MATVHHAPVPVSMSRFLHFDMSIVRVSNIFPSLLRMPIACRSCLQKKNPRVSCPQSLVSQPSSLKSWLQFLSPPFFGSNPGAKEDQEEQAKEAAGSRRASFLQAWRFLGT